MSEPCISAMAKTTQVPPTATVIFGATGDLTHRKIVPAFYHLAKNNLLPDDFAIIGFARRPKSDEEFRKDLGEALREFSHTKPVDEAVWNKLQQHIYYFQGELDDPEAYKRLAEKLKNLPEAPKSGENYLFYLATAPELFRASPRKISPPPASPATRTAILTASSSKKPFGEDLKSARELNRTLQSAFAETDIFRIDHYLGKETVQNLMYFRFANSIYEPIWNRLYIDHVQITVAEKVGVESRGGYYDHAGASRDMLQNHLFQLLTITAMEPPASLDGQSHPRRKRSRSFAPFPRPPPISSRRTSSAPSTAAATSTTRPSPPIARRKKSAPRLRSPRTFVAVKFEIDNWRWHGVPFYLRTGKALETQFTEINIVFKRPPGVLFAAHGNDKLRRNALRIRIQPNEGLGIKFNAKVPGRAETELVEMDFLYRGGFDQYLPEAYERLLVDALVGESTLFTRADEVEEAWRLVDSLHALWDQQKVRDLPLYACGSMGPVESDLLLQRDGRYWISPKDSK